MIRKLLLLAGLCLLSPLAAKTFYVSISGSDATGNGTNYALPWRTIQKAMSNVVGGDTVVVLPGDYYESVETRTNGLPGSPITIRGETPWTATNSRFQIQNPYYIIKDFRIRRYQGSEDESIGLTPDADNTIITNNVFGPGLWAQGTGFTFNSTYQFVSNSAVNWTNLGFSVGGRIYTGMNPYTNGFESYPYQYANARKVFTIRGITNGVMGLNGSWTAETNSPVWALISAGPDKEGVDAIGSMQAASNGAVNVSIVGNFFTNIWGNHIAMAYNGDCLISNNIHDGMGAHNWIIPNGTNLVFANNFYKNGLLPVYWNDEEIAKLSHANIVPNYDWLVGQIHTKGASYPNNILFRQNWLQNIHWQLLQWPSGGGGGTNVTWDRNVFVGVARQGNGATKDGWIWNRNTFYRVGYKGHESAMTFYQPQNLVISSNAFIDIGSHANTNSLPWSISSPIGAYTHDYNYVGNAEALEWQGYSTFSDPNGINGGNPELFNIQNPLGDDGLPFTEDDGLRPLPGSPLATYGIGALDPVSGFSLLSPVAHFTMSLPAFHEWVDPTDDTYDPDWVAQDWFDRTNWVKPWETPDPLGRVPCEVFFDARGSISGDWSTNSWIGRNTYYWNFGDDATHVSCVPTQTHTYLSTGAFTATLRLVNHSGFESTYSKSFRILEQTDFSHNVYHVATNGNDGNTGGASDPWLTISHGVSQMVAGDYLAVHQGDYNEAVNITYNVAAEGNPCKVIGYGAKLGSVSLSRPDWWIEGFEFDGDPASQFSMVVLSRGGPHRAIIKDNTFIDGTSALSYGINFQLSSSYTNAADNTTGVIVSGNNFTNILLVYSCIGIGQGSNILCSANRMVSNKKQSDGYHIHGYNITVQDGIVYNSGADGTGNHSDSFQLVRQAMPSNSPHPCKDILFRRMWFEGDTNNTSPMALCQMASGYFTNTYYTNWTIQNSVFTDLPNAFNDSMDGVHFDSCLFYRAPYNAASVNTGGDYYVVLSSLERSGTNATFVTPVAFNVGTADPTKDPEWLEVMGTGETNFGGYKRFRRYDLTSGYYEVADTGPTTAPGTPVIRGYRGSSIGMTFTNCAFVGINLTDDPSQGWYNNSIGTIYETYSSVAGDYNFVTGVGYVAKQTGGPDGPEIWGSDGMESNSENGGNPDFANEAGRIFMVVSGSPLHNLGTDLSASFTDDYFGRSRTGDGAWNVGPFAGTFDGGLPGETDAPTPDPMTWSSVPAAVDEVSVTMTASTATDAESPPVQYYFEETTGFGHSSGWQSSTTYTDSGLAAGTTYTYRVRARDALLNTTGWSSSENATTDAAPTGSILRVETLNVGTINDP